MARKGRLQEIFSKALYADDPNLYTVTYRDFENLIEVPLVEFVTLSESFSIIPASRIYRVKRDDQIMYEKTRR